MDASDTFERLVADLSAGERRELFRKIETSVPVSTTPLFKSEQLPDKVDIDRRYKESPFLLKVYLRFLSVFSGKTSLKLFEDHLVGRLGAAIEAKHPGLYDHRKNLLLGRMKTSLESLKAASRFFYDSLDAALVRDRGGFYAFLASFEMEEVHRRLLADSDPYAIAAQNSAFTDGDVKQSVYRAVETILAGLSEEERSAMYRSVRSLFCLKELSGFLYDRVLVSFNPDSPEPTAPAYLLADQLCALNDVLRSFEAPPTTRLVQCLFAFELQDRLGSPDFDLVAETGEKVARAEDALTMVRDFNANIPLTALIRMATRDVSYLPSVVTGGEDWFVLFRDFWKRRTEERYAQFVKDRRRAALEESLASYFGGRAVPQLKYASPGVSGGIPVHAGFALGFLMGFAHITFIEEVNKPLKILLLDGEFYKKDNRLEFTDAYNELLKLGDSITGYEYKLAPPGEYGQRWEFALKEIMAVPLKRRKGAALQQEIDAEASELVARTAKAFQTLSAVLGGILHGESGGRYDTLSNMGALAGRSGVSGGGVFISSLRNALQRIDKAVQILEEIEAMEYGR